MKIIKRGGFRIEIDIPRARYRICGTPAKLAASSALEPVGEVCTPWVTAADTLAEARRVAKNVKAEFTRLVRRGFRVKIKRKKKAAK